MGPVESTLPADLLLVWDRLPAGPRVGGGAEPGFTFVVRDGHRGPAAESRDASGRRTSRVGRPRAALVGGMTARDALGLTHWDGWDAPALSELPWSLSRPPPSGASASCAPALALAAGPSRRPVRSAAPGSWRRLHGYRRARSAGRDLRAGRSDRPRSRRSPATNRMTPGPACRPPSFCARPPSPRPPRRGGGSAPTLPIADPGLISFASAAVSAYTSRRLGRHRPHPARTSADRPGGGPRVGAGRPVHAWGPRRPGPAPAAERGGP